MQVVIIHKGNDLCTLAIYNLLLSFSRSFSTCGLSDGHNLASVTTSLPLFYLCSFLSPLIHYLIYQVHKENIILAIFGSVLTTSGWFSFVHG